MNTIGAESYMSVIGGGNTNTVMSSTTHSTISGGFGNRVNGNYSTVGGGNSNSAVTVYSVVAGGWLNKVTAPGAAVLGGYNNTASGDYSAIAGGNSNISSGSKSFVGAGGSNHASGDYSTIGGGKTNQANGANSVIVGGAGNTASTIYSVIVGGSANHANAFQGFIGGGTSHVVTNNYSTIVAGASNQAGYASFVGGGVGNQTYNYAVVAGGGGNLSSGYGASIVGGRSNIASGDYSFIGGGRINSATTNYTTVGGGNLNSATKLWGTVAGGNNNTASSTASTVSGGKNNLVSGAYSSIGGGAGNSVNQKLSTIVGGHQNTLTASYSFIGGGKGNYILSSPYSFMGAGLNNSMKPDGGNTNVLGGGYNNIVFRNGGGVSSAFLGGGRDNAVQHSHTVVVGGRSNSATTTYASVLGGQNNVASGTHSTVGGGVNNIASGNASTIVGGENNTSSGRDSIVLGGSGNTVSGKYSVIAGGSGLTNSYVDTFMTQNARLAENGGVIYSAGTDLYNIFLTTAPASDITRVQPGTNINTGGTSNFPVVNLDNDIILNSVNSVTVSATTMSAQTIHVANLSGFSPVTMGASLGFGSGFDFSGGTGGGKIYSGGTDLYSIFATAGSGVSGSGTDNTIPMWNGTTALENSILTQQGTSGVTVAGNVIITGDVEILGSATTIFTQDLYVEDNTITLNSGGTAASATGGGIFIENGVVTGVDASWTIDANGNWETSQEIISTGLTVNDGGRVNFTDANNYITNNGGELQVHYDDTFSVNNDSTSAYLLFDSALSLGGNGSIPSVNSSDGGSGFGWNLEGNLLNGYRTFQFPDSDGTLALTSDIVATTASNGLTKTGNNITLGGTLTGNTEIQANSNNFTFSGLTNFTVKNEGTFGTINLESDNIAQLNFSNGDNYGKVYVTNLLTELNSSNGTGETIVSLYGNGTFGIDVTDGSNNSNLGFNLANGWYITDGINSRGIKYTSNYHANYDNRTLVDKEYVDNHVATGVTTSTASNGLTKTGNNITLGGTLTGDTTIDTAGYWLRVNEMSATTISAQTFMFSANTYITNNFGGFSDSMAFYSDEQFDFYTTEGYGGGFAGDFSQVSGGQIYWASPNDNFPKILLGNQNYNGTMQIINESGLTTDRTWSFPDASGTVALTSDLGNYLPLAGGVLTGDMTGTTVHASDFFSMVPYTDSAPASPSDNDAWFHSGATGTITFNYRIGGSSYSVELAS